MLRHGLTLTILALMGALLTVPDPTFARPSFRPAFTGGPFRIVIPGGRFHGGVHGGFHRGLPQHAIGQPLVSPKSLAPVHAALRPENSRPFRSIRYRRIGSTFYPVTIGSDASYFGMPYDPSDAIPVYVPVPVAATPVTAAMPEPTAPKESRGCRAERVVVPSASGSGEGEITIVRC